jgi:hypothetical protein
MQIIKKIWPFLLMVLVLSCKKNDNTTSTPTNPTTASLGGEVILYDEAKNLLDKSGMTVSLDSTYPPYSSVTNTSGQYVIPQVPFGNRTLVFEKSGYGTFKIFNIIHAYNNGNGTLVDTVPSLGKISSTQVTAVTTAASPTAATITITTNPGGSSTTSRYVRIFLNSRPSVSNTNYQKVLALYEVKANPSDKTLTKAELNTLGFASGSTVYLRVYGDSFYSNNYDDPVIGRTIFPNLNATTVAITSFIVP